MINEILKKLKDGEEILLIFKYGWNMEIKFLSGNKYSFYIWRENSWQEGVVEEWEIREFLEKEKDNYEVGI